MFDEMIPLRKKGNKKIPQFIEIIDRRKENVEIEDTPFHQPSLFDLSISDFTINV